MRPQPLFEGLFVESGFVEVEPGQGQGRGAQACPVRHRDEAVAQERTGEVQRSAQGVPAQAGLVGAGPRGVVAGRSWAQDGDIEARLELHVAG